MKSLAHSSNFFCLLVIIITTSFINTHPTVFGKHNKGGGHHVQPGQPDPITIQPLDNPVVPPLVEPAVMPTSETSYEIIIINHASEGPDTVNVSCTPGAPPPGPPGAPPNPPCGPPVEPHILNSGERFSWGFEYPDANTDISYLCRIDWIGHNQGLVSLFDRDSYTDAECKSANGNHCYWTIAPDGFYHSREDAPFPGPQWTYRWPWGM